MRRDLLEIPSISPRMRALIIAALGALWAGEGVAARAPAAAPPPRVFDPHCEGDRACAAWTEFRSSHPFPYQAVAARREGGQLFLVISEPPPTLSKSGLKSFIQTLFAQDLLAYSERRWMIGEDGWLEDVMILTLRVPSSTADAASLADSPGMRERLVLLHEALFGTAFGGEVQTIGDAYARSARQSAPNLAVTSAEMHRWLDEPQLTWRAVEAAGGRPLPTAQLFTGAEAGPFVSSDGRLVALLLDDASLKQAPQDPTALDALRAPFRRFAVLSDTVIGCAWKRGGRMALVARARAQPTDVLPPLRFETFQLLARETRAELQQSYERTNVMAGKMFVGDNLMRDWAPIYLSPPLIDTEFGALLNITDQILKSYSEGGQVDYAYFQYPLRPEPAHFLLGDRLLTETILGAGGSRKGSVLFNWNTAGAAVISQHGDLSVLTTRHTGSLAVTYGADTTGQGDAESHTGGPLSGLEDQAYEYFSGLKDPNLARVVSYTLIYQGLIAAARDRGSPVSDGQFETSPLRRAAADLLVARAGSLLSAVERGQVIPFDPHRMQLSAGDARDVRQAWDTFEHAEPQLAADHRRLVQLLANPREAGQSDEDALWHSYNEQAAAFATRIDAYNALVSRQNALAQDQNRAMSERRQALEKGQAEFAARTAAYNALVARQDSLTPEERQAMPAKRQALEKQQALLDAMVDAFNAQAKRQGLLAAEALRAMNQMKEEVEKQQAELDAQRRRLDQQQAAYQLQMKDVTRLRLALWEVASVMMDLDQVRAAYVSANAQLPDGRIKTPSVVVSWNTVDTQFTGGHNLAAQAFKIVISPQTDNIALEETPAGRVLKINPRLAALVDAHAPEIARAVEHGGVRDTSRLAEIWGATLPVRPREQALELPEAVPMYRWSGLGEPPSPLLGEAAGTALSAALLERMRTTDVDAVLVRSGEGFQVAASRGPRSSPGVACCVLLKDSMAARSFLLEVRERTGPSGRVVFEGDTPEHVAALAGTLRRAEPLGSSELLGLAAASVGVAGRDAGADEGPVETQYLSLADADDGPAGFLRILTAARDKDLPLYQRRNWTQMQVTVAADPAAQSAASQLLKAAAIAGNDLAPWDPSTDGQPHVVELSFGKPAGLGAAPAARLLAGIDPQQSQEARELLQRGIRMARQGTAAGRQSLLEGFSRLRSYVQSQRDAGAIRRLNLIVGEEPKGVVMQQRAGRPARGG